MGWAGKITGGILGFLVGGPIGAAIGFVGGAAIDEANEEQKPQLSDEEAFRVVFFSILFSMFAKIAKADGVVQKEEINIIEQIMRDHFQLSGEARKIAIQIFNDAKNSTYTIDDYAYEAIKYFDAKTLEYIFAMLLPIAMADGKYTKEEENAILRVKRIFGISDEVYRSLLSSFQVSNESDLEKAYQILGIDKNSSADEVRKRYKELVKKYHPDVIIGKDLPEDFVEYAKTKFQQIQWAYELIISEKRG